MLGDDEDSPERCMINFLVVEFASREMKNGSEGRNKLIELPCLIERAKHFN